jgi:uncharacterized protein (UPF0264 family)
MSRTEHPLPTCPPIETPDDLKRTNGTQLLVSVRSVEELQSAMEAGVAWIDLKDPESGSLGRPAPAMALEVGSRLTALRQQKAFQAVFSVALGEWQDWVSSKECHAASIWGQFDYCKVGLSGQADLEEVCESIERTMPPELASKWILVHYADQDVAKGPSFEDVMRGTLRLGSKHLLVDTWQKQGRSLADLVSDETIAGWVTAAKRHQITLALAGSLRVDQLARAASWGADWIAVRSAVCEGGNRRSQASYEKMRYAREVLERRETKHEI